MAGWTTDRQAVALAMLDGDAGDASSGPLASARRPEPAELSALIARSAAAFLHRRSQLESAEQALVPSSPHLAAVQSLQEHQLLRVLELEIIPRLMLIHGRPASAAELAGLVLDLTADHVETLVQLAVEAEAGVVSSYVQALIDAGAPMEKVFLDLLAPAARRLGESWNEDRYDFSQVTIGLWRLQQVLHEQGRRFATVPLANADCRIGLLAAVPGSQHTFGVAMAAEFFARAGWDVSFEPKASWQDLRSILSERWVDMIGLSVSTEDSIPLAAAAIKQLRQASFNPRALIMVGGPIAQGRPDLAERCGADILATCAQAAVDEANLWLDRQRRLA